jgi:hypothetical protein
MWGFCLSDLTDAQTYMSNPIWRSLGLYKHPDADWGWDYVRLTLHRIANDEFLETIITMVQDRGHAWWVNLLLIGVTMEDIGDGDDGDEELWGAHEKLVLAFFKRLRATSFIACFITTLYYLTWTKATFSPRAAQWTLLRLAICSVACCLTIDWAFDATVNTVYWQEVANGKNTSEATLSDASIPFECPREAVMVQPKFEDVLIGTSLKENSRVRAMSRFLDFHYGNQRWLESIRSSTKKISIDGMIGQGRFLLECGTGWVEMTDLEVVTATEDIRSRSAAAGIERRNGASSERIS